MMDVGKPAVDERTDEVERQRGVLVAADEELRVGRACLGRELGAVDEVAEVRGQRHGRAVDVDRFGRARAGLGILARKAPDTDDRLAPAVNEDEGHLEEDLELPGDRVGARVGERFGAVAPCRMNRFPACASAISARRCSISHEVTSGGSSASCATAASNAERSGYATSCATGRERHDRGDQSASDAGTPDSARTPSATRTALEGSMPGPLAPKHAHTPPTSVDRTRAKPSEGTNESRTNARGSRPAQASRPA